MHTIAGCCSPREATGVGVRLFRVTLRAQPSDAAFAVHPLVDFSFAFETTNANRLDTRTLGEDFPFALSKSHRFESYFCFGHAIMAKIRTEIKGFAQSGSVSEHRFSPASAQEIFDAVMMLLEGG
jgi:hypothetical protein